MLLPPSGGNSRVPGFTKNDFRALYDLVAPRLGYPYRGAPDLHDFEREWIKSGRFLENMNENLIAAFLGPRLSALGCRDLGQYIRIVKESETEFDDLMQQFLVNQTWFFRAPQQFKFLLSLPPFSVESYARSKKVRIWSAGCSTGEEAYSIAMLLKDKPHLKAWDIKIDATDASKSGIDRSKRAEYPRWLYEKINDPELKGVFLRHTEETLDGFKISDIVRRTVNFQVHNLLDGCRGKYDVILCRNVIMYFRISVQNAVLESLYNALNDGGILAMGAEQIERYHDRVYEKFECIFGKKTFVYRKKA
jgi:chemotaxis protein methyltransferase CheR